MSELEIANIIAILLLSVFITTIAIYIGCILAGVKERTKDIVRVIVAICMALAISGVIMMLCYFTEAIL